MKMCHAQGGGGEVVHGHVGWGESAKGGVDVELLLNKDVLLLLHGATLLGTPVLEPDFHLKLK